MVFDTRIGLPRAPSLIKFVFYHPGICPYFIRLFYQANKRRGTGDRRLPAEYDYHCGYLFYFSLLLQSFAILRSGDTSWIHELSRLLPRMGFANLSYDTGVVVRLFAYYYIPVLSGSRYPDLYRSVRIYRCALSV